LPVGTDATNYLFGESGTPITGVVYKDTNLDSSKQPSEPGLPGVPVVLKNAAGTIIASTVTDANGNYSFPPQPAGNYSVEETQPAGYGSSENPSNIVPVTVVAGTSVAPVNFGETPSSLSGQVFRDDNNDGIQNGTEPGIPGASVLVTGKDIDGANVSITTTTDANGNWKVDGLKEGIYTITETQPVAYNDGKDTNGTVPGTLGNYTVTNLSLPKATQATGYNFAETGNTITGQVYKDSNADGLLDPNEAPVPGVLITLKDANGNDIDSDPTTPGVQPTTTTTASDGTYNFPNLPAGNYRVVETQPNGLGSSTPNSVPVDVRTGNPTTVRFGDTPSSISGVVYIDTNNNGLQDAGEAGIAGVIVALSGTDANGVLFNLAPAGINSGQVNLMTTTDASGNWKFGDLLSGTYTVKETQPTSFTDGKDTDGSIVSTLSNDQFANIVLPIGTNATNYRFGELNPLSGALNGKVYNDINGDGIQQPTETGVPGVTVTAKDSTGNIIATTTTGADGSYSFPKLPAGLVQIVITPLPGYVTTTPNPLPVTIPAGGTLTAPATGITKPSIGIVKNVVQGDTVIPSDQPPQVVIGSTLSYQIKVTNDGVVALSSLKIVDVLPLGLVYIPGSSSLVNPAGKVSEPTITDGTGIDAGRKVLTYTLPDTIKLEPGQSINLRLTTAVTPSTPTGEPVINKAQSSGVAGGGISTTVVNSTTAVAGIKVSLGVFATPNVIVGRVYFDRNNDNNYTAGIDVPLSGARVYLSDGRFAVTDANGNYSIPEITPGVYAIRLDPITAPYPVKHVPDDQGAPGTRYVRANEAGGIITEDFMLLEPNAAAVKARTTTVQRGPVTLNKSLVQGGAGYAVNDKITLDKAVNNLEITDPLPNSSAERGPITVTNAAGQAIKFELLSDGKTIRIPGTLPAGTYTITYALFTALPPDQVLTDPDINYEEILLGVFGNLETNRISDEVTR
jgi:uncharacterized repeat protein (TIGR01451 family)